MSANEVPVPDSDLAPAEAWFAQAGRAAFDFQREAWRAYLTANRG